MNTREIAVEYRLMYWAQILRERSKSGLSIKAFCKSKGFHENVNYYWQNKYECRGDGGLTPSNPTIDLKL